LLGARSGTATLWAHCRRRVESPHSNDRRLRGKCPEFADCHQTRISEEEHSGTRPYPRHNLSEFQRHRPPQVPLYLSSNWRLGLLPLGIHSDALFDAYGPAAHNLRPTRQFSCRYAICRKVEPERERPYAWGHDGWGCEYSSITVTCLASCFQ
jgi:hypothetical protein